MVRSKNTIATPPGATIREQLEDRGMTQKNFALRMNLSEKHVSQLINGDVRLTPEIAERLEMVQEFRQVFGIISKQFIRKSLQR